MIYMFEDGPGQSMQRCILQCYPEDRFNNDIFFTSGNRNILSKLDEFIQTGRTTEEVVIYLDLVPDNDNTRLVYQQIDKEYKNKFRRLIVLPIPCIEFYYIKACASQPKFMSNPKEIRTVLKRGWHKDQKMKLTQEERQTYWQFEKFCKLAVKRALVQCLHRKTTRTHNIEYFQTGCTKCFRDKCCCNGDRPTFQINAKKKNLLYAFPCVPAGSNWYEPKRLLEWGDLITIHRCLVNKYNGMCDTYNTEIRKELGLQEQERIPPNKKCRTVKAMY